MRVTLWTLLLASFAISGSHEDPGKHHGGGPGGGGRKPDKMKKDHQDGEPSGAVAAGEEAPPLKEGLRCYKCDPTENNNFCRDFKPRLATPYDCAIGTEVSGKQGKTSSPLNVIVDPDMPFSCYKVKGDAAYGHGKVYGAKRYGCGHVRKIRTIDVVTGDSECAEARMTTKGNKDFFDGTVCNCDGADGCNSADKPSRATQTQLLVFSLFFILIHR